MTATAPPAPRTTSGAWLAGLAVRHGGAPVAVVLTAATAGLAVLRPAVPWGGDWEAGLLQLRAATLTLLVIVAVTAVFASSAWIGVADAATSATTAVRRRRAVGLVYLAAAAGPAAVLATVVAWLAARTAAQGGHPTFPWVLVHLVAALLAATALGATAGRLAGPWVGSGAAAVAVAGSALFLPAVVGGTSLWPDGGGGYPTAGMRTDAGFVVVRVIALAAVTAALVVAVVSRRRVAGWTGVAAALLVAGMLLSQSVTGGPYREATVSADVCGATGVDTTQVCVFPGYQSFRPSMVDGVRRIGRAAVAAGLPGGLLPRQVRQTGVVAPPPDPGVATILVDAPMRRSGAVPVAAVASALATPTWCPQLRADTAPVDLLTQSNLVAAWLLVVSGAPPQDVRTGYSLTAAEAAAVVENPQGSAELVARMLEGLRACRPVDLALPDR